MAVKDSIGYQCSICKLHYTDEKLADECHAWCSTHQSCNFAIAEQSVEAVNNKKKSGS